MRALFADLGAAPFGPDSITAAATRAGLPFDFVLFYNPWRAAPEGKGKKPFEELSKAELFDSVFEDHPPTPGPLWYLPDDCFWSRREPYLTSGETLREFVMGCRGDLAQDALFIWTETPRVSLIHHEGGYTHIFLPDVPLTRAPQP
ncbi:hypothetical protein R5W23_002308 [Gemmata sp. JC673]|uniref:Uncharacterized protein n=1 Tax=Gemmata algarum TaxID=2975278 RepID=A0ABU5F1I6_9BACT|nr:hypothetical protein [Gemmata algarum]MDY3561049.1 hypothetical protein [Gemmata algarum]